MIYMLKKEEKTYFFEPQKFSKTSKSRYWSCCRVIFRIWKSDKFSKNFFWPRTYQNLLQNHIGGSYNLMVGHQKDLVEKKGDRWGWGWAIPIYIPRKSGFLFEKIDFWKKKKKKKKKKANNRKKCCLEDGGF